MKIYLMLIGFVQKTIQNINFDLFKTANRYMKMKTFASLAILLFMFGFITNSYGQLSFSTTPTTTATVGTAYSYSAFASDGTDTNPTVTCPTKPAWLTFSATGSSTSTQFGDAITTPGGIAGDADGNTYVVSNTTSSNGGYVYKISPDGATNTTWAQVDNGYVYAMNINGDDLYVSYYVNSTLGYSCIRKISLTDPAAGQTTFYSKDRQNRLLSLVFKDGFVYASNYGEGKIEKINMTTGIATDYVTVSQPFGLGFKSNGDLYIAAYGLSRIYKFDGTTLTTAITPTTSQPSDVKIDNNGYIYVSAWGGGIRKYAPTNYSTYESIVPETTNNRIWGMNILPNGSLVFGLYSQDICARIGTGATISGTPATSDIGPHSIVLTATNATTSVNQEFTITVQGPPTISNFPDISGGVGTNFTLTAPTSNSSGAFSYASSNTSIATISGSTVTPIAAGTSTITATQAANGNYTSGTITCILTVSLETTPTVTTQAVSTIATTTATGNGNITSLGNPNPTQFGVCWSLTSGPTVDDSKTTQGTASATGAFTSDITGLTAGTKYYVKAYATNSIGTVYGSEVNFTTLEAPTVTTQAVSSIATTTATGNGYITDLGNPNPTQFGVCWSTTSGPTIANNKTIQGAATATGAFTSSMTGLTTGTKYYVKAYATNSIGTVYGSEINFTTLKAPTVTTQAVSSIATTTATGNGNITDLGNPNPTQFGVCWSTTSGPTVDDSKTTQGVASATGAFTSNITGLTLGTIYYVRAYATNSIGTVYGDEVSFTSLSCLNPTSGGTIASDQTICYGATSNAFTSSALPTGHTGTLEYKWQLSSTGSSTSFNDIASSNAATYTPGALTATTWYKRLARVTCESDWSGAVASNVLKVTVRANFTPGEIAATGETICYNGDPAAIGNTTAASGGDASITYKWESSTDAFATAGTIISGATATTYDPPAGIQATTSYRRYAHDGACNTTFEVSTGTWTVTAYSEFVVGSISSNQSICYNSTPAQLVCIDPTGGGFVTNGVAPIRRSLYTYQWQSSTDNQTFTDITGATSLNYQPGALTTTTYYKLIQSSGCGDLSTNTVTVTVYSEFVIGSISGAQTICYNTTPSELTGVAPSGGDGTYTYQWQSSSDNSTFTAIPNATSLNYQPGALTATTYYRLQQYNACSGTRITNTVAVYVIPEFVVGSISSNQNICYNTAPAELIGVAPTGGRFVNNGVAQSIIISYTYQWQSSTDGTTFTNISGATSLNYQPAALTATTYYKLIQSSGCGDLTTNTVTITVYSEFVIGSISGNQTICNSSTPDLLIGVAPSGGNGTYTYQWQNSTNGSTFTNISGATSLNYQPGALTTTTYYKLIQSSGCGDHTTNTVTITVYPEYLVGSISANQSICYNTAPAELAGVAPTGGNGIYTYQWQVSSDNSTFTNISGATSLNYQAGAITATRYYQLLQTNDCGGTLTTNKVSVTVYPLFVVGSISGNQTICYDTAPDELIGVAPSGADGNYSYQWQHSDDGITFYDISGATLLNYQAEALTATTYYQLVQSSVCADLTTNKVTVNVRPFVAHPVIIEKKESGNISLLLVDNSLNLYFDYLWTYADGSDLPFDLVNNRQFLTLPISHMNASYIVTTFDTNDCSVSSLAKTVTPTEMLSSVYPTINNGDFKMALAGPEMGQINVKIYNERGSLLKTYQFEKMSDTELIPIIVNDLQVGSYFVEISINNYKEAHRIFIR